MSEAQRDEVIPRGAWQFDQEVTAVLVHDLRLPSKFLEHESSDYICLLGFAILTVEPC